MRCPVCQEPFVHKTIQCVAFDICAGCRGIWVAGEQLCALVAKYASDTQVQPDNRLLFQPRIVAKPDLSRSAPRQCPACYVPLLEFNFAYDSNVFVDRCDTCKGIWIDTDKIEQIARHMQYDPDIHVTGRALLDLTKNPLEESETKFEAAIRIAVIVLRYLPF